MRSEAWKDHERKVAKYFRTTRRLRGSDFSQSDVEVLADVDNWLGWSGSNSFIVAECKYSKKNGIVKAFKSTHSAAVKLGFHRESIPLFIVDRFVLCNLENFEDIFCEWIHNDCANPTIDDISTGYTVIPSTLKAPKYLSDYREQAQGYAGSVPTSAVGCLPIVCMALPKTIGRVVSVHLDDIEKYISAHYATNDLETNVANSVRE
jgi:hypothetical protein